jgi:hypothetical protein
VVSGRDEEHLHDEGEHLATPWVVNGSGNIFEKTEMIFASIISFRC